MANIKHSAKEILKKIIPEDVRRNLKIKVMERRVGEIVSKIQTEYDPEAHDFGINLFGNIKAEIGLGQSMRLVANALEESGIPFTIYNLDFSGNISKGDESFDHKITNTYPYGINLFHIEPYELGLAWMNLPDEVFKSRYNIAYWLWELEVFPPEWEFPIPVLDEIWTPSRFVTSSIQKVTEKPVITIPYHLIVDTNTRFDRAYFDLPEDKFLVLAMYDVNSSAHRKNPVDAVKAYVEAFGGTNKEVGLVLKVNNPSQKDLDRLLDLTKDCADVFLVSKRLSKEEVDSLIKCVDVFISMHRAEGFGLVMAEAMALSTVCVATDWSSNTEFMNDEVACMVDYDIVEIEVNDLWYRKGNHWAQPKVASAAKCLNRLYEDKEYYSRLQKNALEHIRVKLGQEQSTQLIKSRLENIEDRFNEKI
ncbi:MAG: glycosyltransferase family 4 protein [Erysipelotrichaceae bacterium]|nr:glycosyltransferase family 4 protein [Erysipelotrichaceae bacterium]